MGDVAAGDLQAARAANPGDPENPAIELVWHSNGLTLIFYDGRQESFRAGGALLDDLSRREAQRKTVVDGIEHRG